MFEFFIKVSSATSNRALPNFKYKNEIKHTEEIKSFQSFTIKYLAYKNQFDDFDSNERYIVVIYGSVYHPINAPIKGKISAKYILNNLDIINNPLKNLRGNYAVIIYDKNNNTLLIKNDPLGLKPIYYYRNAENVYISSSLILFKDFTAKISNTSLLEKIIFSYNLGSDTVLEDVFYLGNGCNLMVQNNRITIKKYFDIKEFALSTPIRKFEVNNLLEIVNNVVANRGSNSSKVYVTLTGGNDGRAVLSSVKKANFNFETFSFGRKNGENTFIPNNIAKKLAFIHKPVYLDNDFLNNYFENSLDTIDLSDGNLSFEQQSTLYCYKNMCFEEKSILLTGLLAGEILGPIHQKHDYFNEIYFDTVYTFKKLTPEYILSFEHIKDFVNSKFIRDNIENINAKKKTRESFVKEIMLSEKPHLYYYLDLIELGFRKFYGSQMHLIRYYIESIPVFYDLDILAYLLNTDFNKIFNNSFKNLLFRWNSRVPQSYITRSNYPALAKLPLDRGFTPAQLLHPFLKYLTWYPYLWRKYIKKDKYKDFDSPNWCKALLNDNFKFEIVDSYFFETKAILDYIRKLKVSNNHYSNAKSSLISDYIFIHRILT